MPSVEYDAAGDVLYVNWLPGSAAVKGQETKDGKVWRYAASGQVIGVTILDFSERVLESRPKLED